MGLRRLGPRGPAQGKVPQDAELLQCWPHISRKFEEGEYVSTTWDVGTWEHFEEAKGDLYALPSHTARREASPGSRRGCNGDGGALASAGSGAT